MNEENIAKIFVITFLIIIFIVAFGSYRSSMIAMTYDDFCEFKYGENYVYEYDSSFGKYCIKLVYENLTKIDPMPFNWTNEEIREICETPNFFELNVWNKGLCEKDAKEEKKE